MDARKGRKKLRGVFTRAIAGDFNLGRCVVRCGEVSVPDDEIVNMMTLMTTFMTSP
jgi:hypothetical protein